jgi:hypothetical protein
MNAQVIQNDAIFCWAQLNHIIHSSPHTHKKEVLRMEIERPNVEQANVELPNVEFYNIDPTSSDTMSNVECR